MKAGRIIGSVVGNAVSLVGLSMTDNQLATTESVVSIVCTILGLLITIICAIVIPLIQWWNKAKKDGKIDEEEINEALDIIKNGSDDLKDKLGDKEDKSK